MTNLFEPQTAAQTTARIEALTPSSKSLWGKMNVAQMLAHCSVTFETFFGNQQIKQSLAGLLFGRIAKRKLVSEKPFPKNLPTAKEFVIVDEHAFDEEQKRLLQLVQRFATTGKDAAPPKHPFFGKMGLQEWARLAYKHTDHHLQQFGV